ncbi:MAG: DEAD/DEAH box helicase [Candidatus Caldarchaeum sp.]|nr:DEAD/DEAH box helicase [Candidatus Caldarchaeum sp.]
MIDTGVLLDRLGYDYIKFTTDRISPSLAQERFSYFLKNFLTSESRRCHTLAEKHLYLHQKKALDVLMRGENLVLKAGTGSGKTEAWFLYTATKRAKTLAVYPTLALSNDQLERLQEYSTAMELKAVAVDALRKQEMLRAMNPKQLRSMLKESDLVITNPAYLLNELKRIGSGKPSFLKAFLAEVKLVVLDEFDFYGPRSIAILLTMLRIMVEIINPDFQITIMTATLQEPEEVARTLTEINGRQSSVVDGEPFQSENRTYLVLGKSLKKVWDSIKSQKQKLVEAGAGADVIETLEDYEKFRMNFFKVIEAARAAGVEFPDYFGDVSEILRNYVDDDALTIAFTLGISSAEEMARRIGYETRGSGAVATHHHLLLKTQRREIENAAKNGFVKLIFTPRTLSQGIDIGAVRRIVHLGLPDTVREFRQREGRKGRRPDIPWTETVIIPFSQWDRDLLSRGIEVFKKWLDLPLEKTIANRQNLYGKLFKTLFDYQSPLTRNRLSRDDVLFLRELGLESDGQLTKSGKLAWLKMNFYEFAPPYGIKRWRISDDGGLKNLEDISHVDMVEKFQPGAIDPSSDGVVVEMRAGGRMGRVVTAVVVDSLVESRLRRHDALAPVLEEYERTKLRWGEEPNIRGDFHRGSIRSIVHLVAQLPAHGFGYFTEFPNRVEWRVYSNRKKLFTIGERTFVSKDVKTIEVPTPTYGVYGDYTYGMAVEASPLDDVSLLRLGASFILIVLRRIHHISLFIMKYDMIILGERKFVRFYEGECAGYLPTIDWLSLRKDIENYRPDELDEILLEQIEEQVYSDFLAKKLDWEVARAYALKIIDYALLKQTLKLRIGEKVLTVPKPSKALKIVAMSAVAVIMREDLAAGLYGISIYDGEEDRCFTGFFEFNKSVDDASGPVLELSKLVDKGFSVVVYGLEVFIKNLEKAGLDGVKAFVKGLEYSGKIFDAKKLLEQKVLEEIPLDVVESALNLKREVVVSDLFVRAELEKRRRPSMKFLRSKPEKLVAALEKFLRDEARSTYMAYLIQLSLTGKSV